MLPHPYGIVVAFNTFTLKTGVRNFRFRRRLCGNLTGWRRAEHRSSGAPWGAISAAPGERARNGWTAFIPGGGPERAARWYGRGPGPGNLPKKPVQTASPGAEGGCWGWRAGVRETYRTASGLRRAALTDGCVCFRAAVIRMGARGCLGGQQTPPANR